jgi:peptide/nickel transport system permease protein
MVTFLVGRLAWAVVVMLVVSVVAFGLYALAPGDPARLLLAVSGMNPVPEEAVVAERAEMRLDDPLVVRYLTWLGGAVQGDLGRSFRSYQPVTSLYLERLPATILLATVATLLSCLVAVPLGTLAAYQRGGPLDSLAQLVAVLGVAMPSFWVALIAMFLFAATLQWLPAFGSLTPRGIVLPAGVLALANLAVLTRLTRATVLDVLSQEYVTVAKAKGLMTGLIARRHVLPERGRPNPDGAWAGVGARPDRRRGGRVHLRLARHWQAGRRRGAAGRRADRGRVCDAGRAGVCRRQSDRRRRRGRPRPPSPPHVIAR